MKGLEKILKMSKKKIYYFVYCIQLAIISFIQISKLEKILQIHNTYLGHLLHIEMFFLNL